MTSLTDYICINHHLMTVKEMAEETGATENWIRKLCSKNSWAPLAPVDRLKDYIKAHPGAIAEDIAERFDTTVNYVRELASREHVELTTRFQAEGKKEKPKKKVTVNYSLMHRAFHDTEPVSAERRAKIMQKYKHVKEPYNQSGSPYGIADKFWGKKLK